MGQKVNPIVFRLKINSTWASSWYSDDKSYAKKLHQDISIREVFNKKPLSNIISKVIIDRSAKSIILNIYTSKPGLIISKKIIDTEKLKFQVKDLLSSNIIVNIIEIKRAEIDPVLVARSIADQLERRVSFRKVLKRAINLAIKAGINGIRVNIKGRLGGSEIARTEWYKEGRVPLHTLRAQLIYGACKAQTVYGAIGVKVWIYNKNITNK